VVTRVTAGSVVNEDGALLFDASRAPPGIAEVTVADRLTRETTSVRVLVGEPLGAPPVVRGPQTQLGDLASGDVNGDGLGDLVVGHAERSRGEAEAGGILVACGERLGSLTPPAVVVEGRRPLDHQGAALLVVDMNGDGIDDVVAGAPDENLGENDRGSVAVYLGEKGGLEPTPDRVLVGEDVNNLFGAALAAADLDGDGAPELVTSAPNARSPFAPACVGGRVYVYRNLGRARGAVAALPYQVIDIREPWSAAAAAKTACSASPIGGGSALALVDMDGDKTLDLVIGAPQTSFPVPGRSHGAVLVYRGARGGSFEDHPSWAIHLAPDLRLDGALFGVALDVVRASPQGPAALVVRAPGLSPRQVKGAPLTAAGGLFVFPKGALGPAAGRDPSGESLVRVVTTDEARAFFFGDAPYRGVGRSAAVGDVDPRPGVEYLVGEVTGASEGHVAIFSAAAVIEGRGALVPFADLGAAAMHEQGGARLAVVRGALTPGGALAPSSGLAIWAPWRSTSVGPFVGAIDWVQPGAAPLAARIGGRVAIPLANYGAGDRAGTTVAFARLDKSLPPDALVGAPGAQSPGGPGKPAGARLRPGVVDISERGAFGASIALARAGGAGLLLLGAPKSSRGGAGGALGAA
jgi:FG-GAP repeat